MSSGPARGLPDVAVSEQRVIVCDVGGLVEVDMATVDALARLQLAAQRSSYQLRLRNATRELTRLLVFAGLAEALGLETLGQAEEREERLGVEEERELPDPAA